MRFTLVIFLLAAGISCKRKLSHNDVESELKKAMTTSFYKAIHDDSAEVKFQVITVNYFEDKNFYECEFKVHVTAARRDTTGFMGARISKDFSTVARKF